MYHLEINGSFEIVADRGDLYNLLEQNNGLREVVKLLRDLDQEQEKKSSRVRVERLCATSKQLCSIPLATFPH